MSAPVVHFEIQAQDPARCQAFYEQVFGWTFMSPPGMKGQYWLIIPSGEEPNQAAGQGPSVGIGGGMLPRSGPPPVEGGGLNAYVNVLQVEDIAASASAITSYGGQIVVPATAMEGIGTVLYAKDTEGNIFGVMQPAG